MEEKVSVLCMKWGTAYSADYVNRLYNMVRRHLTKPFQFICFTDDSSGIQDGVIIQPIPDIFIPEKNRYSPWKKLVLHQKDLAGLSGKALFLDLDVVIIDNIDCFFDYSDKFAIIENWTQKGRGIGNSSVFTFTIGQHAEVFDQFVANPHPICDKYDNEQIYLSEVIGSNKVYYPEEWCRSFKRHCIKKSLLRLIISPKIPEKAKIIVFHGSPKPDEAAEGRWPGRLIPYMRKAPWVKEHWH